MGGMQLKIVLVLIVIVLLDYYVPKLYNGAVCTLDVQVTPLLDI